MMSKIEWTDEVWNPVTGCSKVSEGCRHCYAEGVAHRFWGNRPFTEVRCHEDWLDVPLHWKRPRRIFVNSMSDLFHEDVPEAFIDRVFFTMFVASRHTYQILTKRPARMQAYLSSNETLKRLTVIFSLFSLALPGSKITIREHHDGLDGIRMNNVWLGVSVEDQATADERIPILLKTPAAVRWVSAEPLLGPISFDVPWPAGFPQYIDRQSHHFDALRFDDRNSLASLGHLDWVVVGGESGTGARSCDLAWIRSIVGQCKAAAVPCFVKQLGARCKSSMPNKPTREEGLRFLDDIAALQGRIDRKGANIEAFPEDLRVREWPR